MKQKCVSVYVMFNNAYVYAISATTCYFYNAGIKDEKTNEVTNLSTKIYISSRIEVDDFPSDCNTPRWTWLDLEDSPGLLAPKIILTHRGPVSVE